MNDVYVTEHHPVYHVWVSGRIYDSFVANRAVDKKNNTPLTWSEQWDVAKGYQEALDS